MDITQAKSENEERRAFEERLQHAQKLESLGVLAGGIAHDFNNLLMGILGNAGLALAELPAEAPARKRLEQIETASLRAAELTNQMLAYAGKGPFVVAPLDLSRLVGELAPLLRAASSKKAVISYDLSPRLSRVEGDATQLRQVVMNLITNASDAIAEESGVISIRTGVMIPDEEYLAAASVSETKPGLESVFLEVADTGSGMDEETKAKIFEPFFTTKFTGRGLGLAGVLGIVRGHQGAIRVDSEPGEGTTVRVLLPAVDVHADTEAEPATVSRPSEGVGTVLVVDDEETVRQVARASLERSGFTVLTADDGRQGVEAFRARAADIDVVLLDLTMPTMSGKEAMSELRSIQPDVRILFSSGYSEEEMRSRVSDSGPAVFIQKPYRPAQLVEKIRETLRS
jgi:nitrogen-specific signal transduction histidine kinase/CheY-like chemotaxis protein